MRQEADAERPGDLLDLRQMRTGLARRVVHRLDRGAGELELAARLERDGAAAGHVIKTDRMVALEDRLPAEQVLHALEKRPDAAPALVGHRRQVLDVERDLLVLGADAPLRLGLHALRDPVHEFALRADRRRIRHIAGHSGTSTRRFEPGEAGGEDGSALDRWVLGGLQRGVFRGAQSLPRNACRQGSRSDGHGFLGDPVDHFDKGALAVEAAPACRPVERHLPVGAGAARHDGAG